MKRLTILAVIGIFAMSATGCGGRWSRWWNRGAPCWPQQQQQTFAPVEVYEEGTIIQPGTAPPPSLPPLPGPVQTAPGS